ncbi:hypothetical protein SASPL_149467 [Salvia splendens]|uniref:MYB-related transcription factor LHY n=1 Tax=Salvia splendens TaxID=180675 RepID=A0A8X8Z593_SALSN|nr:transcription factor MYB1R1-like [Salvia splendens]KAG6391709.1 hypothetical protein SASPL_149467 [Salvia splendens]
MSTSGDSPATATSGVSEIMLFGVRLKVDPMRKSVSMNNLSEYEQVSNASKPEKAKGRGGAAGYASADDAASQAAGGIGDRKRGTPWTEEEHKRFLVGLQKVGKGDWRGISKNYVKTRTPTQVASHAQKYFIRRSNLNCRRRRTSLFDITTDSVAAMPMKEARNRQQIPAQPVARPPSVPRPLTSNANLFSTMNGPVLLPMQGGNPSQNCQDFLANNSSAMFVHRRSPPPTSAMAELSLNQQVPPELSQLSLRLSLSTGSSFPVTPSYKKGDGIVSVA